LEVYSTKNKKVPFFEWLEKIDYADRVKIKAVLTRIEAGNLGNFKSLKGGLYECKIDIGPGYRIYYAKVANTIILLLAGGSKRTQSKDIEKSREYLNDYKMEGKDHGKK